VVMFALNFIGPGSMGGAEESLIEEKISYVNDKKAEIIFFGTSVCTEGVDEEKFSQVFGRVVSKHCGHIQRSTYYYLFLKNVLLDPRTVSKPKLVVILFREGGLTDSYPSPNYGEELYLRTLTRKEDHLRINQLLYNPNSSTFYTQVTNRIAVFKKQEIFRAYLEKKALTLVPDNARTWYQQGRTQANQFFAAKNMMPSIYGQKVDAMREGTTDLDNLQNFQERASASFLPDLVALAQNSGIKLVFLHVPINGKTHLYNERYLKDLAYQAKQWNIPVLDYSTSVAFDERHFPKNDRVHLNATGRQVLAVKLYKGDCN
jgi:hypothetical protein